MRKPPLLAAAATGLAAMAVIAPGAVAHQSTPPSSPVAGSPVSALSAMPSGSVTFSRAQNHIRVHLSALGVTPGSSHGVDLQTGGCPSPFRRTPTHTQLEPVQADANGEIDQTLTINRWSLRGTRTYALTVREGVPGPSFDGGGNQLAQEGVACVTLPRHVGMMGVQRRLQAVSESGKPTWGSFSLSYDAAAQTLTVHIKAMGFIPGSVHAAHIHRGSCMLQGAPIYMLGDLTADRQGDIDTTVKVANVTTPPPASGWYLNVHQGPGAQILDAAGNPTLKFRPLACGDITGTSAGTSPAPGVYGGTHS